MSQRWWNARKTLSSMEDRQAYYSWAPPNAVWSPWAKPVLFASFASAPGALMAPPGPLPSDTAAWVAALGRSVAFVIDLPGELSVARSLQLSQHGIRPVPLFNTTWGDNLVVPVRDIIGGLRWGADVLAARPLADDAPPAFLLDADRQLYVGPALPGKYDNRWLTFPQDFPSAEKLREHGIATIVLWQRNALTVREDLAHVLLRWQQAGLAVRCFREEESHEPEPIMVSRPSHFRGVFQRLFALIGFKRNAAGGFGAVIPQPSSGYG